MKRLLSIFIGLISLILQSCSSQGFKQNIEINESVNEFINKVDSIVALKMNNYNIPGLAIGLVINDSIIYCNGYGVKNIENINPVTENSNFHTASISKLFTAQAIMMLVEKRIISLDEKLINIAPELKYKDKRVKKITIQTLLNHTSGLPDVVNYHWGNNNQSNNSLKDYILDLDLKLRSEPSSEYYYSNLGYNILGYVVEKISEISFDQYVKENILNASGMLKSDFRYFKIPDSLKTSPHSKSIITKKIYLRKTYPYTREQGPSSTLNSSANELSKWMISFLKAINNTNPENTYSKMLKPSSNSFPYIGLGFQINSLNSNVVVGHYGGDKGYRSYLLMIPEKKIGLILLANCDYNEDFRQEIIHPIAKLMLTKAHLKLIPSKKPLIPIMN